ncbi:MAG: hypothetical protein PHY15_07640 [Eubacteriales bacterium]|nr:hypothetical protein [Eubacteriales bacterium]
MDLFLIINIALPFLLTAWNIYTFIVFLSKKKEKSYNKLIEVGAVALGLFFLYLYLSIADIELVNWDVQLYNTQKHSMIAPDSFFTIVTILILASIGYLLIRFIPVAKQTPIVSAFGIASVYLGIGVCFVWCIQTINYLFLVLLPANCIIIFIKTIYILVYNKNALLQNGTTSTKYKKLSNLLYKATNLPWIALILVIPLLGVVVAILLLFGQEPDSVIKAWTETADWTMSQKIAPPNIQYDEHYLCTVAAGGHRKVVKPIRVGIRHGHRVVVNRQLCVANAFEQVLSEKVPVFHRVVRTIYDKTGYPISKHIHSKYLADIIYFIMKPLEWFFLLVLYTVEVNPENRIAVQYPHSKLPTK